MNRPLKIILIIFGIFSIIIGGFFLFIHIAFGGIFEPSEVYSKQDLINNYEKRKVQINDVKSYVDLKVPDDTYIYIEFEKDGLGIFHIKKNGKYESNWNLKTDSPKTDSLLTVVGWTKNDLKILKEKLYNANCISVASGKPVTIGWQRSGMGAFSYKIFDKNLNDSLINQYNDGCIQIFYKDNVVLEYGGGVLGPQCFPEYKQKEYNGSS